MPTDLPPPKPPNPFDGFTNWLVTFAIQHGCNLGALWLLALALRDGFHRALPIIPTWALVVVGHWFMANLAHTTGYHFTKGQAKSAAENFFTKKP